MFVSRNLFKQFPRHSSSWRSKFASLTVVTHFLKHISVKFVTEFWILAFEVCCWIKLATSFFEFSSKFWTEFTSISLISISLLPWIPSICIKLLGLMGRCLYIFMYFSPIVIYTYAQLNLYSGVFFFFFHFSFFSHLPQNTALGFLNIDRIFYLSDNHLYFPYYRH